MYFSEDRKETIFLEKPIIKIIKNEIVVANKNNIKLKIFSESSS